MITITEGELKLLGSLTQWTGQLRFDQAVRVIHLMRSWGFGEVWPRDVMVRAVRNTRRNLP